MKNEDMEETIMSSVNDLLKAIANRDYSQEYINEDISFVNERFDKFRKYFNAVYEHVYGSSRGRRETDRSQWLEWRTVFTVLGSRRNHFRNWIWRKRRWTLCPTGLQTDRQR